MNFDHLPSAQPYLDEVLEIVRSGISKVSDSLARRWSEGRKNQHLAETFNIIGTQNVQNWIGCNNERVHKHGAHREDIYFYLNNDEHTKIFMMEAKRLPKPKTENDDYVVGMSNNGKPCGGIQRYKLNLHGEINHRTFGMIAYIEKGSILYWLDRINGEIRNQYPEDSVMREVKGSITEFDSEHSRHVSSPHKPTFRMRHFWITLLK